MTYAEIETDTRKLLQDQNVPYRWSGAEIYGYISDAILSLFVFRPTALFVNGRMPSTLAALKPPTGNEAVSASGAVTANVNDRYQQAIVYFVAAKCLERDNSDTGNITLSSTYMNNFAALAKS